MVSRELRSSSRAGELAGVGTRTRVVDREGAARRHEGWSRARGWSDSKDARERETSLSVAEAANSRSYEPTRGLECPRNEEGDVGFRVEF